MLYNGKASKNYKPYFVTASVLLVVVAAMQFFFYKKCIAIKDALLVLAQTNIERANAEMRNTTQSIKSDFVNKLKLPEAAVKTELWYLTMQQAEMVVARMQNLLTGALQQPKMNKSERLQLLDSLRLTSTYLAATVREDLRNRLPPMPLAELLKQYNC